MTQKIKVPIEKVQRFFEQKELVLHGDAHIKGPWYNLNQNLRVHIAPSNNQRFVTTILLTVSPSLICE